MGWIFHNRINKEGKSAIIYQVSYSGDTFTVSTGITCKRGMFKNGIVKGDPLSTFKLDEIKKIILTSKISAKERLPFWTTEYLKRHILLRIQGHDQDNAGQLLYRLKEYWGERIQYYKKAKKIDTANHHQNSLNAIFKVLPDDILLTDLNKRYLREIVEGLENGRSSSTLNGYLRDLRVVINTAISEEVLKTNPFFGFKIPKMSTRANTALTWQELEAFKNCPCRTPYLELVRDMAMFRYYCLGMRVKDQFLLTKANINKGVLTYITSKNKKQFSFKLPVEANAIIDKHYQGGRFIFPILKTGDQKDVRYSTQRMNKALKRIAKNAKIEKSIGTHTFRHTFTSINQDWNINDLQNALGHGSVKTTEGYKSTITNQDNLINKTRR